MATKLIRIAIAAISIAAVAHGGCSENSDVIQKAPAQGQDASVGGGGAAGTGGGAGAAWTDAAGNDTGTGGIGGDSSVPACPDVEPFPGDGCAGYAGAHCVYDRPHCHDSTWACNNDQWGFAGFAGAVAFGCPSGAEWSEVPAQGERCDCNGHHWNEADPAACSFPGGCAMCSSNLWHVVACDGDSGAAGSDASDAEAGGHPAELPSKQKVTFEITNKTAGSVWVVSAASAQTCTVPKIEAAGDGGWQPVELAIDPKSADPKGMCCVTSNCDPCADWTLTELAPDQTFSFEWDARGLVFSSDTYTCYGPNYDNQSPNHQMPWAALQPVAAGEYRGSFAWRTDSSGCLPGTTPGTMDCGHCNAPQYTTLLFCGDVSLNGPSQQASATFSLPATGDVTVPVEIH